MSAKKLELKLIPVSKKLTAKGGYRGHIADRGGLDYDEVIQEVLDKRYLRFTPDTVKMVVEAVFDTMIEGIMQDGQTRRLGDYLMLQYGGKGWLRGARGAVRPKETQTGDGPEAAQGVPARGGERGRLGLQPQYGSEGRH